MAALPRLFKGKITGTWIIPVNEEPVLLVRHYPHRAWSVGDIFHMREVSMSRGG